MHFFQLETRKKAGHFKLKSGKRDGAKKREFTPESGNVDTYEFCSKSGNIGTGEHRFGEHRYRGTYVGLPGNIGSGNIGTGEHRYRGT